LASFLTNGSQNRRGEAWRRDTLSPYTPPLDAVWWGDGLIEPFERATPALAEWLSGCGGGSYITGALTEYGTRVVVGSPEALESNTKAALETILTDHGMGRPLYITDRATRSDDTKVTNRLNAEFQPIVNSGASIGASGSNTSGSFGGYVRFEDDDAYYGITCHHVITTSAEPVRTGIAIHQPADSDWVQNGQDAQDKLRRASDWLDSLKVENKEMELVGRQPKNTEKLETIIRDLERLVERTRDEAEKDTRFGVLCETSGLVTSNGRYFDGELTSSIDWALFKIEALHRLGGNIFPGARWCTAELRGCSCVGDILVRAVDIFGAPFAHTGVEELDTAFENSDIVAMISKNSGQRFGKYSLIKHLVKFEGSTVVTTEHAIMNLPTGPFSRGGDSGSWILNCRGNVIGMRIGGSHHGGTYFTPVDLLIDSIEKATGKKMRVLSAETS
jgi:hypothetical protein